MKRFNFSLQSLFDIKKTVEKQQKKEKDLEKRKRKKEKGE